MEVIITDRPSKNIIPTADAEWINQSDVVFLINGPDGTWRLRLYAGEWFGFWAHR